MEKTAAQDGLGGDLEARDGTQGKEELGRAGVNTGASKRGVPESLKEHVFKKGEKRGGYIKGVESTSGALKWRMKRQPKLALAIADSLYKLALQGKGSEKLRAIEIILERLEGSPEYALRGMEGVMPKHVVLEDSSETSQVEEKKAEESA